MTTTTLAAPVRAAIHRAVRAPRSKTLDERFMDLAGGYRLFGTLVNARQIPKMQHLSDIGCWIAARSVDGVSADLLEFLHVACIRANPAWYETLSAVRLLEDSRGLNAGLHYFSVVSNFSQIPDASASLVVREGCTEAMLEHPDRDFLYFEPYVVMRGGVREFVTRESCGQLLQFQQKMIARVANRVRPVLYAVRSVRTIAERIARLVAPRKAREAYGLSKQELDSLVIEEREQDTIQRAMRREQEYLRSKFVRVGIRQGNLSYEDAIASLTTPLGSLSMSELMMRYDPIIAFEVPEFSNEFKGRIPIALVAHWD